MGKTSAAAKNKYAAKAYDRYSLMLKKGQKEQIRQYAESKGYSINGFINKLIADEMGEALIVPGQQED